MNGLGRFIFWDVKRASWQYDVIVGLILVFIFLTPRSFFADQPSAANISMLPAGQGYLLEPALLEGIAEEQQAEAATGLVRNKFKSRVAIENVQPIYNGEELTGYIAR